MPIDNTARGGRETKMLLDRAKAIYFAGICGISMSGLAHMAKARGKEVRGCDRALSCPEADALRAAGIATEPESAADPAGSDLVVYTAALSYGHPALSAARAHGIPLCSRADFLAALMEDYPERIAVAGMHGKSTTVGMLAAILEAAGLKPTVAGGAPLCPEGQAWRIGGGKVFLCEACEYRDSFLSLSPTLSVVTNIDLDHPDYFPSLNEVKASFTRFLSQSENAVIGGDCPALRDIASPDFIRFGFSNDCRLRGVAEGELMQVWEGENLLGTVRLSVPGMYNRENALAALAAGRALHIPFPVMQGALSTFRGIGRRMEYIGLIRGARAYLDYAHHPTEIAACIRGVRTENARVICLFQPHTYTRTHILWKEFTEALRLADHTVLIDIYPARETPIDGVTSERLAQEAGAAYAPDFAAAAQAVAQMLRPGDVLLIMGAGDIPGVLRYLQR